MTILSLKNGSMLAGLDSERGGLVTLVNKSDDLATNFLLDKNVSADFSVDSFPSLGNLVLTVAGAGTINSVDLPGSPIVRHTDNQVTLAYSSLQLSGAPLLGQISLETEFSVGLNEVLTWTFTLANNSDESVELTDVGFPLPMSSYWPEDQTAIYEQSVIRHTFIALDGSYVYWQRCNGQGPYLVMTPQPGTHLEFKNKRRRGEPFGESDPKWEGLVEVYIHSKNIAVARGAQAGSYLPSTSLILDPGTSRTYGFDFSWATNYSHMRDIICQSGGLDVISLPGMVVPTDQEVTLSLRAKGGIHRVSVSGQSIPALSGRNDYAVYTFRLPLLGSNRIQVAFGKSRCAILEYWAIEPVQTLVSKRCNFLVEHQQSRHISHSYNGAFLQWDMSRRKLITWHDYPGGGWKEWMAGGSDDAGLGPAVFLSEKNVFQPLQAEIDSLDYYIKHFIQGYMQNQRDSQGRRTFAVYRWYDGQDGAPNDLGVWRSYNYTHIANTYFNMYRIARCWGTSTRTQWSALDYLTFCYETLNAMFHKIPFPTPIGKASWHLGEMGEHTYPQILKALRKNGMERESVSLTEVLHAKYRHFADQAYPFASEMSIDTTGFETSYTLAKMHGDQTLQDKAQWASMACRGMQPLWYFYGSDNRHMGESWWNLGYETQLGSWQQQDYLVHTARRPLRDLDDTIRVTSGASLAGWANVNSGQISSHADNDGAASWIYQSEGGEAEQKHIPNLSNWAAWSGEVDLGLWGGLKSAAVNVTHDPVVGLYALCGTLRECADGWLSVIPKDGVRQRLTFFNLNRLSISLEGIRYTKARLGPQGEELCLTLEKSGPSGEVRGAVSLYNLEPGRYIVNCGEERLEVDWEDPSQTYEHEIRLGATTDWVMRRESHAF